jgi:hypothetical protein
MEARGTSNTSIIPLENARNFVPVQLTAFVYAEAHNTIHEFEIATAKATAKLTAPGKIAASGKYSTSANCDA